MLAQTLFFPIYIGRGPQGAAPISTVRQCRPPGDSQAVARRLATSRAAGCWRPGGCLQGERRTDGRAGCVAPGRRPFRAGWPPPSSLDAAHPKPTWLVTALQHGGGAAMGQRKVRAAPCWIRVFLVSCVATHLPETLLAHASPWHPSVLCSRPLFVCDCTGSLSIYE